MQVFLVIISLALGVHCEEIHFVSPGVEYVGYWEGWGTSMAWWPDILGAMDEQIIQQVTHSIFSPDKLNINIVRYAIGGTTPGELMCGPFRDGGATESFKDSRDLPYDWTRDPRQRRILQIAKDYGANVFEAFSNSPPQWMTISGCSKGRLGGGLLHNNLDLQNVPQFAEYAADVIEYFHQEWNVTFDFYSPFNEPSGLLGIGGWMGSQSSQEGCNLYLNVMVEVVKSLDFLFKQRGMDYVKITAADETQVNRAIVTQNHFRKAGISGMISKVNTHGYHDYFGNRRDLLFMNAQKDNHILWMNEMGWGESDVGNMEQGMNVANRIVKDIRNMLPSAWLYWQVMEDVGFWGLVSVPYREPSVGKIKYTSGFYAMQQFSKYIKRGSKIIHSSGENTLAAYEKNEKILTLVVINEGSEEKEGKFYLPFAQISSVIGTISSENYSEFLIESLEISESEFDVKHLSYVSPPFSITTFSFLNTTISEMNNLIENGDFESGGEIKWKIEYSDPSHMPISSDSAWKGLKAGILQPLDSKMKIFQAFVSQFDGKFFLTAWCSSNALGTKLGVEIRRDQSSDSFHSEVTIGINGMYKAYSLIFEANEGDSISVYYSAEQNMNFNSFIDEVSVYGVPIKRIPGEQDNSIGKIYPKFTIFLCIMFMRFCLF